MKSHALALALVSTLVSPSTLAISHKTGVITEVDLHSHSITVEASNGREQEYTLSAETPVWVDGKLTSPSELAPQQKVTLKLVSVDEPAYTHAEILALNLETGVATVKPLGTSETLEIAIPASTKVSGKAKSVKGLAAGQTIKFR